MTYNLKPPRPDCQADALAESLKTDSPERDIVCQADTFESGSTPMSRPVDLTRRTQEYVRRHGVLAMVRKAFRFLSGIQGDVQPGSNLTPFSAVDETDGRKKARPEEVLNLQAGEYIEIMYQEESGKVRRLKHTVLLDGVHCDGMLMRCDRACFFFWREAWMRRVDAPESDRIGTPDRPARKTDLVTISMPSRS